MFEQGSKFNNNRHRIQLHQLYFKLSQLKFCLLTDWVFGKSFFSQAVVRFKHLKVFKKNFRGFEVIDGFSYRDNTHLSYNCLQFDIILLLTNWHEGYSYKHFTDPELETRHLWRFMFGSSCRYYVSGVTKYCVKWGVLACLSGI